MDFLLSAGFALVAILYSAVGQAGGTGYIAVMGLAGFPPEVIKPTALALNIMVAAIGCFNFYRAGLLTWRSCYPFAILGAPFSLWGGTLNLPASIYLPVVGTLLLLAAIQMTYSANAADRSGEPISDAPFFPSLILGGFIGFASGVTGVGGGIYLAPIILMLGWATTRQSGSISAAFNLMNSAAALAGVWSTTSVLQPQLPFWLLCVGVGGALGSWLGISYFKPSALRIMLAALLLVAGLRMIFFS